MKFTIDNPMPPHWMMCPHIGPGSLGWRMGFGEVYAEKQYIWYRNLAEKARLFDHDIRKLIMKSTCPKEIKRLGRKIGNFKQEIWNREKYSIVVHANYYKFTQNDEMRNFLFSTGNKVLVEASPFDTVWGIGLSENDDESQNPNAWRGQNLLGFALMDVRDDLRKAYQNYDRVNWSLFSRSDSNWTDYL